MGQSKSTPHQEVRGTVAPGTSTEATEKSSGLNRPSGVAITASALAAITSTVALSYLGVAGTIIGVGLSSVLTVLGNYIYSSYLDRTRERVRAARAAAQVRSTRPRHHGAPDEPATGRLRALWDSAVQRYGLRRIVGTVVAVFVLLLGAVTVVESIAGRPVSDIVRNEQGAGTSLFGTSPGDSDPALPADPDETTDPEITDPDEITDPAEEPTGQPGDETSPAPTPDQAEPAPDEQPPAEEEPPSSGPDSDQPPAGSGAGDREPAADQPSVDEPAG